MSALIKLCFILLIIDISILMANPVIPENSDKLLAFQHSYKELSAQSANDHGYMNDEPPAEDATPAAPGEKTTTGSPGTTTPTSSSLSVTPNVFLSLASLLPVLICKYA